MTEAQATTLCTLTDLPPDTCGCPTHHQPGHHPVITIAALERLTGHPLPAYRPTRRDPRWKIPEPQTTVCTHRTDDLCGPCGRILNGLLHDLPDLVSELHAAMRKDTRFKPHGHRQSDRDHSDESSIPWNPAAARTLGDLNAWMADVTAQPSTWSRHRQLARLSALAERAHRIIERPEDREYSMCPRCRGEITVTGHDWVICPADGCRYAATWATHQADLLDAMGDAMLTLDDLVLVLTRSGEPINRNRVNYLIRRHGLPREEIENPKWREGRLVTEPQWVYRLRDVRDLQARLAG
ncbi:MAG: hypothetical protein AAGC63_16130 [Propionicimonas sp.]